MMKWALIAMAIGGFLYYKAGQRSSVAQTKTPEFKELVKTNSCANKSGCVLLYVAPWCSACLSMSPLFQQLKAKMENDPEYGMKIIVGQERNPGDNARMAKTYGEGVLIDSDNKIHKILEIDRYPTLLLVDSSGLITKKHQDVFLWAVPRYQLRP